MGEDDGWRVCARACGVQGWSPGARHDLVISADVCSEELELINSDVICRRS